MRAMSTTHCRHCLILRGHFLMMVVVPNQNQRGRTERMGRRQGRRAESLPLLLTQPTNPKLCPKPMPKPRREDAKEGGDPGSETMRSWLSWPQNASWLVCDVGDWECDA